MRLWIAPKRLPISVKYYIFNLGVKYHLLFLLKVIVGTLFKRGVMKENLFAHSTTIGIKNFPYIWFLVVRSSYLYNANSYNGKAAALYWGGILEHVCSLSKPKQYVQYPADVTLSRNRGARCHKLISYNFGCWVFFRYATYYISSIDFSTFVLKILFETIDIDRNGFEKGSWSFIVSSVRAG